MSKSERSVSEDSGTLILMIIIGLLLFVFGVVT